MFNERTTVGLDVHDRPVVAEAVDWSTGAIFSQRLTPTYDDVLGWVSRLPGPVAVTYEPGLPGWAVFAGAGCVAKWLPR